MQAFAWLGCDMNLSVAVDGLDALVLDVFLHIFGIWRVGRISVMRGHDI